VSKTSTSGTAADESPRSHERAAIPMENTKQTGEKHHRQTQL
jgi:hypothetical protein